MSNEQDSKGAMDMPKKKKTVDWRIIISDIRDFILEQGIATYPLLEREFLLGPEAVRDLLRFLQNEPNPVVVQLRTRHWKVVRDKQGNPLPMPPVDDLMPKDPQGSGREARPVQKQKGFRANAHRGASIEGTGILKGMKIELLEQLARVAGIKKARILRAIIADVRMVHEAANALATLKD